MGTAAPAKLSLGPETNVEYFTISSFRSSKASWLEGRVKLADVALIIGLSEFMNAAFWEDKDWDCWDG